MNLFELKNPRYQNDIKRFKKWLETLNYSKSTAYNLPNSIKEFLNYLEQLNCYDYSIISTQIIDQYFDKLSNRRNLKRQGALSYGYLHKHLQSIKKYIQFLQKNEIYLQKIEFPFIDNQVKIPQILTVEEIKLLFKYCGDDITGKRDKAMLALYYGCGLRKIEGIRLNVEDIDFNKAVLFVRKSKTHRQRYVPINQTAIKYLEDYLYNAREILIPSNNKESAFLINTKGKRYSESLPPYILKRLLNKIDNEKLTAKTSIHVLRHSIATHLLKAGMNIENIALFLGHISLDSTQIYTHIATQKE